MATITYFNGYDYTTSRYKYEESEIYSCLSYLGLSFRVNEYVEYDINIIDEPKINTDKFILETEIKKQLIE